MAGGDRFGKVTFFFPAQRSAADGYQGNSSLKMGAEGEQSPLSGRCEGPATGWRFGDRAAAGWQGDLDPILL